MTRRILITGGAGFIGSNFVNHLSQRYPEYTLIVLDALTYAGNLDNLSAELKDSPNFQFWQGNVCNSGLLFDLAAQVDTVVHFAAETHVSRSIHDDRKFFETDVLGTQAVANAVYRYKDRIDRFIHISTSEVYGSAQFVPMTEEHPLLPSTPYAAAKAGADRLVYSYYQTYKIPAVILRLFNQFGPHQHLEKVIPRFITSALLDEPLTIHGSGQAARDWLYVRDTCRLIEEVLHLDLNQIQGQVFNIGSEQRIDILGLARAILDMLHKPHTLITHMDDRPGQVDLHLAGTQKIRNIIPNIRLSTFEDALEQTIAWYEDNQDWWWTSLNMRQVPIRNGSGRLTYY
ncbi:MAG: GDP-mannose 4,6-dehydratase [Desulfovermiculus sp.]|nr:GDP-mannose 4,6-dehydratase [Desulfovermiculus sp.]